MLAGLLSLAMGITTALLAGEPTSRPAAQIPQALRAAFAHRISLETLHAKYTYTRHWHYSESPIVQHREDRIANKDIYSINRGDDDEVIYGPRGVNTPKFGLGLAFGSYGELMGRSFGEVWRYHQGDVNVSIHTIMQNPVRLNDIRSAGCGRAISQRSPTELYEDWLSAAPNYKWTESRNQDNLIEITAIRVKDTPTEGKSDGPTTFRHEWLIDPSRDYAILRCSSRTTN